MNSLSVLTTASNTAHDAAFANSWESIALQCQFRVSRIAEFCHVSTRTLERHFRRHYNTTISGWLREVRLEKARQMLKEATAIKCVAFDLGYKQPSHFTRDFKLRFGFPPSFWVSKTRVDRPLFQERTAPVRTARAVGQDLHDLFQNDSANH